jgi:hypothetical protein
MSILTDLMEGSRLRLSRVATFYLKGLRPRQRNEMALHQLASLYFFRSE